MIDDVVCIGCVDCVGLYHDNTLLSKFILGPFHFSSTNSVLTKLGSVGSFIIDVLIPNSPFIILSIFPPFLYINCFCCNVGFNLYLSKYLLIIGFSVQIKFPFESKI